MATILELPATGRERLFGIEIDAVRMHEAVEQVLRWAHDDDSECRFVVTPNVDHAVKFQTHDELRGAYADASLVLVDGTPLVWAARLLGRSVPERVAGSDLVPALLAAASEGTGLRVFLLGAAPGVARRAGERIEDRWPGVEVAGCYSPPLGFEHDDAENQKILSLVRAARPDVLLVGLGAPKQELWVAWHRSQLAANVALCIGATIDFLAGERRRAPVWMRRAGLEWFYRVAREPRRLAARYLHDAVIFPRLIWREWRSL